jgi:hypothetical protein
MLVSRLAPTAPCTLALLLLLLPWLLPLLLAKPTLVHYTITYARHLEAGFLAQGL